MGICSSCESTSVATAKLVLHDGQLQEFSRPVKVSHVLQKNPAFFICNSDDMEFNDFVSAINGDEELLPGELYFALPMSWSRHPLQAEEIASLAVKASSALRKSGGGGEMCGCIRTRVDPVLFSGRNRVRPRRIGVTAATGGGAGGVLVDRRRRSAGGGSSGGRRGRSFTKLSVVPEE